MKKLLFDVGGTNTRIAVFEDGKIGEIRHSPTDKTENGLNLFIAKLIQAAGDSKIDAIIGGFPGQLLGVEGEVMAATNLPRWVGQKIRKQIESTFRCNVSVVNDVALCGLGESHYGAGSSKGVMIYYTISTGVNAIRLKNGRITTTPSRCELGYQIINYDSNGKSLSLEDLVGGDSLQRRLGMSPSEVTDKAVWIELEKYMVAGIYNSILYWGADLVVLGGKMMRDLNIERIELELHKLPKVFETWPTLKTASLHDEGGIRGAMAWLGEKGDN